MTAMGVRSLSISRFVTLRNIRKPTTGYIDAFLGQILRFESHKLDLDLLKIGRSQSPKPSILNLCEPPALNQDNKDILKCIPTA